MVHVGIKGIGTYLPDRVMTAAEIAEKTGIPETIIVEKFGVKCKPIPTARDTTSYMGIRAAQKALAAAEMSPEEIDLVIWNGAQHKDYPCWLAGLKVADAIGATNAWSFDMEAMCGSMMAAMKVAKSMLIADDALPGDAMQNVLIVSGYRNVDLIDITRRDTQFMLDIGAGGAAMVLQKGYRHNVLLGTAFKGDGSFAEDCVVPVGGAKRWPMHTDDVRQMHFVVRDVDAFKKKLGEKTMPNFYQVIRASLAQSGLSEKDIDYLAILHFKRSAHLAILEELGLREDQTTYLEDFGHLGQNDQLLSIELGLQQGRIKAGDHIVMVGAGLGFVWASAVVKWGAC